MRLTLGTRHYAGQVARAAGMVIAASPPVSEDTWGCVILSRLPVLRCDDARQPRRRIMGNGSVDFDPLLPKLLKRSSALGLGLELGLELGLAQRKG